MIALTDNSPTYDGTSSRIGFIIVTDSFGTTTRPVFARSGDAVIIYQSPPRYQSAEYAELFELELRRALPTKLELALERTRAAVDAFAELVRRLPPRAVQSWASPVEQRPPALEGLRRWKRRTCGEHQRYRVRVP